VAEVLELMILMTLHARTLLHYLLMVGGLLLSFLLLPAVLLLLVEAVVHDDFQQFAIQFASVAVISS
jgi:hypothetical protein